VTSSDIGVNTDTVISNLIDVGTSTMTPNLINADTNTITPSLIDVGTSTMTPNLKNADTNTITPKFVNVETNTTVWNSTQTTKQKEDNLLSIMRERNKVALVQKKFMESVNKNKINSDIEYDTDE
jgi:hypothetical protein